MAVVLALVAVGAWLVSDEAISVGDVVAKDQPLCEITTDKAQLEISSPKAGRILKLHGQPGDIIGVHKPLVEIDESAAGEASARAGLTKRQPIVVSNSSARREKAVSGLGMTRGARDMDSTPPARAKDWSPARIARAAWPMARAMGAGRSPRR